MASTANLPAIAVAIPELDPLRKTPYTDDRMIISSCAGYGMCGFMSGKTSTDSLPFRFQTFCFQTTFLTGNDTISITAAEVELLTSGVTDPLTEVGFPATLTNGGGLQNHGWTDMQQDGSFFNRYSYLLIGLSFKPMRASQVLTTGASAGQEYLGVPTTDTFKGLEAELFTVLGQQTSVACFTPDEECITRLSVMDHWKDGSNWGNQETLYGGGAALCRDFMCFVQAILVGGRANDQLNITLTLANTILVNNQATANFTTPVTVATVTTIVATAPLLVCRAKFWGHATCNPPNAFCVL